MTPTRPNNCIGTGRTCRSTSMAPPRRARHISLHTASVGSRSRRGPRGFRFYHTHLVARGDLRVGQYGGEVGPVYIEPAHDAGAYDREVFLTLKEFEPFFSQGGDMAMDFLSPASADRQLKSRGEDAMRAALARGMKKGFEVGYRTFTINGRQLGFGEPVRVKRGERVLFHVLNGSATEIRSLVLPGHRFKVIALDGNPVPHPREVSALWLG